MSEPRPRGYSFAAELCPTIAAGRKRSLSQESGRADSISRAGGAASFFQDSSHFSVNDGHFTIDNRTVHIYDYHALPLADKAHVDKVLELIPSSKFRAIQDENMANRTPETGTVIVQSAFFQKWLSNETTEVWILWGTGIPGAGKTMLAALVVDTLERAVRDNPRISVAYAYFRYTERPSLGDILTALVRQQVETHPNLAPIVEPLFTQKRRENRRPSEDDLVGLLQTISRHFDQTFYSLDGLDEAPREMYIKIVTTVLKIKSVKLWMTSRPLKDIEDAVSNVHLFTIEAHEVDIRKYVEEQLKYEPGLAKLVDRYGREEFICSIQRTAGGMFLHAVLQMNALRTALNLKAIQDILDAAPHTIHPLYSNTLNRINDHPNGNTCAKIVLIWLVFGPTVDHPLTLLDLQTALAFDEKTQEFNPELLIPEERLLPLLCGLVTVDKDSRVRLVHYTAHDVLRPILSNEFHLPQLMILKVCIARLQAFDIHTGAGSGAGSDLHEHPLLAYAYDAWTHLAQEVLTDAAGRDTVFKFVSRCSAYPIIPFGFWHTPIDVLSQAHLAAMYNFTDTLERIFRPGSQSLEQPLFGADVNARTTEKGQTPLMLAVTNGHSDSIQILLDTRGVDVNLCDSEKRSALIMAAENGHSDAVRRLLTALGIQVDHVRADGRSPLILAAKYGHKEIVQMLLNTPGVDVNRIDKKRRTALMLASRRGQTEIVRILLLDARSRISVSYAEDVYGATALIFAADHPGDLVDMVQLLLEASGSEVDHVNEAFMYAATFGNEAVARLLLDVSGVEIDRTNREGCSAFIVAASRGRTNIVRMLLNHGGVAIDRVNGEGWSALMVASNFGFEDIVEILLGTREVDVNRVNTSGECALVLASRNGHTGTVRLLLDASGADSDVVSQEGGLMLQLGSMLSTERGDDYDDVLRKGIAGESDEDIDITDSDQETTEDSEDDTEDETEDETEDDMDNEKGDETEAAGESKSDTSWATSTPFQTQQFAPTETDFFTAYEMLLLKLPATLVVRIMHEAEYWPRLFAQKISAPPETFVESSSIDNIGACRYYTSPTIPELCLYRETSLEVQRVIFRTVSHDQGWGGEACAFGLYNGSFTWFEAGILRDHHGPGVPEKHDGTSLLRNPFNNKENWFLQKNIRASGEWFEHEVAWDTGSNTHSNAPTNLGSGDGHGFVHELRGKDRIAIFAKAQYPGWRNHVSGVSIEILYSPVMLPEPTTPEYSSFVALHERHVSSAPMQYLSTPRRILDLLVTLPVFLLGTYLSLDPRSLLPARFLGHIHPGVT